MKRVFRRLGVYVATGAMIMAGNAMATSPLPEGFVRLSDIAPDIRQDLRYAGPNNFTGKPVPGYVRPVCILARPAAEALKRVQARLVTRGLALAVFDCYRPRRAVAAFLSWANKPAIAGEISTYLPTIARSDVLRLGYVAGRSSHSRGVAVDATIVRTQPRPHFDVSVSVSRTGLCNTVGAGQDFPEGLDMGTRFDCFDKMSHAASHQISNDARHNRALLQNAMEAEGFRSYPREWWHFTIDAPTFKKEHDFVVD